jgi:uncharacterized protein YjbJ (UPF0337 family)
MRAIRRFVAARALLPSCRRDARREGRAPMSTQTQTTRELDGSVDQIGGKMKETVGAAKGDRTLELEGKVQGALGRVRKKSAELVARVAHAVRQATESAEHRLEDIVGDDLAGEDTRPDGKRPEGPRDSR